MPVLQLPTLATGKRADVTEAFISPDVCRESYLPESSAYAPRDLTDDFRRSRKQGGGWILWIQLCPKRRKSLDGDVE